MQLVPLFDETKQFLRQVETADSSGPRMDGDSPVDLSGAGGRNQLMQLVPLFEETKQLLRQVETVDKSGPLLGAAADEGPEFVSAPGQQQLMQLIPLFEETKQFLRKVETVDKSVPALSGWGAEASTPPPLPSRSSPPARSTQPEVRREKVELRPRRIEVGTAEEALQRLMQTMQYLQQVETVDRSAPDLSAWGTAAPPPPPPMLPQAMARQQARDSFADESSEHLFAIQHAASKRSQAKLHDLKSQLGSMFSLSGVSLERAFRALDTNRDGSIDYDEFAMGLYTLGAEISEGQLDDLISVLDIDGSGAVDYSEFARWFGVGAPPPPPLPEVAMREEAMQSQSAYASAATAQLMQLIPLFEETKQFLHKVETVDKSNPYGVATAAFGGSVHISPPKRSAGSLGSPPAWKSPELSLRRLSPAWKSPELSPRRLSPSQRQSLSPRSPQERGPSLVDSLFPVLGAALARLEAERPENPLEWLGRELLGRTSPLPSNGRPSALQMMSVFDFFDSELAPVLSAAMTATQRSGATGQAAVEELGHCLLEMSR